VLDHVEAGRVLEQPAGKHAAPLEPRVGVRPLVDEHLDEGAGFGRLFPRRGAFARRQAQDDVTHALRFARLQLDVAADGVALVEQSEHRDALGHRRADLVAGDRGRGGSAGQLLGNLGLFRLGLGCAARARRQRKRQQREGGRTREPPHASGVHAS